MLVNTKNPERFKDEICQKRMKNVDSQELINWLEEQVDRHLRLAVENLQNLPDQQLLSPAADGGWSIAQCLWHLNSYGDFYLPQIEFGIKKHVHTQPSVVFKSSWVGRQFTKMMDSKSGQRKIKAFKNHVPNIMLDASATVAEFIRQQEELLRLLKESKKVDLNKIKIPLSISRLIKLKVGDVFQFLIAHDERHIQQIKRILKTELDLHFNK